MWRVSRVCVTETGFELVNGFINNSQVVATINYNTVPDLHDLKSFHYNLLSLFSLVFTIHFLATDLNTRIITDSHFKYHCTKSLLITINTALPLFLHFMIHCYTHTSSPGNAIKTRELALQTTPNITHEESLPLTHKIFSNYEPSAALCSGELTAISAENYCNLPSRTLCKRASVSPINPRSGMRKAPSNGASIICHCWNAWRHCWRCHVTPPHSCVIQVFVAVAWQQTRRGDARRCATRHGTANLGSARQTSSRHGEDTASSNCCVIAGTCFDVTVLTWRKYATILCLPKQWQEKCTSTLPNVKWNQM
jgi:hypothetical protein